MRWYLTVHQFEAHRQTRGRASNQTRPFYNMEECVADCVESPLGQDFDDYEVVCIDDGSTDGTGITHQVYSPTPNREEPLAPLLALGRVHTVQ